MSLAQLRSQDEPFWTALAVGSLGWVEVGMGRYDDALRHLRDAYDLGDGFDSAWLAAWSRVQLGTLDIVQGRKDEARDLLNEALALSLAAHSTGSVTLCLVAFARLCGHGGRRRAGGTAGRGGRGPAAAGWPASVADVAARGGRPSGPDPPSARRGTVRPGVRRRRPAQPAGRGDRCPGPGRPVEARTGARDGYTRPFGILMVYPRTDRGACSPLRRLVSRRRRLAASWIRPATSSG